MSDPEPEPCRRCLAPILPGQGWCETCDRIMELESFAMAIFEDDWAELLRLGGPSDDYDFRTPESFHTEGSYEADARYIYPEREELRRRAARAVFRDPAIDNARRDT
jgi:hypothetical protein